MQLDLEDPDSAHLLGFLLGDGSLYAGRGQKGRLTVELSERDANHLNALARLLPGSRLSRRTRTTNFAYDHTSGILTCCSLEVRRALEAAGMPAGRKDTLIAPPAHPFSSRDFARGLVDADGSLGFTGTGLPFVSLVTTSEAMARWWCAVLLAQTGAVRTSRPNRRDGARNVMVMADPAVALARWLYTDGDLALPRKARAAVEVQGWQRPPGMRARSRPRRWTAEEDAVLLAHVGPLSSVAQQLGRSSSAVSMRLWRLRHPPSDEPISRSRSSFTDGGSRRQSRSSTAPASAQGTCG